MNEIERRCFEAGEGHIQLAARNVAVRHGVFFVVAKLCLTVESSAAGIRHSKHARDLIEAFPRRVVARRAEDAHFRVILHVHDQTVSAGNDKADERRLQLRIRQIICRNMSADVMHRHQRHIQRKGRRLRKVHANQNCADQPRRIGHGDRINVLPRQLRSLEGLICQRVDCLNVLPRGDLRHHAAVKLVDRDLRSDAVGQNFTSVAHDGDGSFVAGGFHR